MRHWSSSDEPGQPSGLVRWDGQVTGRRVRPATRRALTAETGSVTDQDPGSVEATERFRAYLCAPPGVGKTYSMRSEGRRRRQRGADVAIGFVECHGRQTTEELIDHLEVIRRRV